MSDKMHHAMKRRFSISLDYAVEHIGAVLLEAGRSVWVRNRWVAVLEANDKVSASMDLSEILCAGPEFRS